MGKFKKILVDIKSTDPSLNGKTVLFRYLNNGFESRGEIACDYCSYDKICSKLKDPENPDNENLSFVDFCNNALYEKIKTLLEKQGESLGNIEDTIECFKLIPESGELEKLFKNSENIPDVLKQVLDTNTLVELNEVVDNVCSSGFCEKYTPEHIHCTSDNSFCIFKNLFIRKNKIDE